MPPDEHDDAFRSDPASWLLMNTTPSLPLHVHEPWPYVCASRRLRPRPYVRTWPYLLSCTLAVRTCTCYVRASTTTRALPYSATVHRCSLQTDRSTSMYVHVHDQNDNAMYALTMWVPTVRDDKEALPCMRRCSCWVPAVREGNHFVFLPGCTSLRAKV